MFIYMIYYNDANSLERLIIGDHISLAYNDNRNIIKVLCIICFTNNIANWFLLNLIPYHHLKWLKIFDFLASKISSDQIHLNQLNGDLLKNHFKICVYILRKSNIIFDSFFALAIITLVLANPINTLDWPIIFLVFFFALITSDFELKFRSNQR